MVSKIKTARIRSRRADDRRYYTSFALLALMALVIVWQTVEYRGVIAVIAEWQFDVLGRYRPILTYLIIMTLLSVPLYLAGFFQKQSTRRRAALPTRATRRALRLAWSLLLTGLTLAIGAAVAYALIPTPPDLQSTRAHFTVSTLGAPPTGPVTLEGDVMYDRTTALDERMWLLARSIRFAPVVVPGAGGRGGTLRYFVAFPATEAGKRAASPSGWTGVLRQGALPGEVVRLYRYAGYRVATPHYVLFTQPDMLTWSDRLLAFHLLVSALIALIGGMLQLAHARRMLRELGPVTLDPQKNAV